jgi:hypothetical protein
MRECAGFDELLQKGEMKFSKFNKALRALLASPQLQVRSSNTRGSHLSFHLQGAGFTLVEHHTGGGKDRALSLVTRTRVAESLLAAATAVNGTSSTLALHP